MASSIKKKHGVGSPEMFQDPLESLGRQAFELTIEEEVKVRHDGVMVEEGLAERLEELGEEVARNPVLSSLDSQVWTETRVTQLEGGSKEVRLDLLRTQMTQFQEKVHRGFFHLRAGSIICPLPVCSGHAGQISGFHFLFEALKDRRSEVGVNGGSCLDSGASYRAFT